MAAGQLNKIGCIIQARMNSTRLPGKILLPLPYPEGEPLIGLIINQLAKCVKLHQIIVASSIEPENDTLEAYCLKRNVHCYRGSENNVLSRFIKLQQNSEFDHIFRFTADNPIIDIRIMKDFLAWHIKEKNDYSSTIGLPLGMNFEVFTGKAILKSENYVTSDFDTEHVTPVLKRKDFFKKGFYNTGFDHTEQVRLTVDTVSDFLLTNAILRIAAIKGMDGMNMVNELMIQSPWLFEGNSQVWQKNRFASYREEMKVAITLLKKLEYFKAANHLEGALSKSDEQV